MFPCTSLSEEVEAPAKYPPPSLPLSATLAASSLAVADLVGDTELKGADHCPNVSLQGDTVQQRS